MKKIMNLSFAIVLVLGLLLANPPRNTVAADSGNHPLVADGEWSTGTEVAVDLTITSAPSWLQLLTNGVKITSPTKICHGFNGGRFGWVGEIRQLVKGKWVKLATVSDWVPSTEGVYTACAQAPAAGTYALFGYWIRPANYVEYLADDGKSVICSAYVVNTDGFTNIRYISSNSAGLESTSLLVGAVHFTPEVPTGTLVGYTVTSTSPGFIGGGTHSHDPIAATDIGLGFSGYVDYVDESGSHWIRANVGDIGIFDFVFHIEGCGDVPYHVSLTRELGH